MNNQTKRGAGKVDQIGGRAKKALGALIGNQQMQAEGSAREVRGKVEEASAKQSARAHGKLEEVTGDIKKRVGQAIDNQQMQAEGKARELKGRARQKINR